MNPARHARHRVRRAGRQRRSRLLSLALLARRHAGAVTLFVCLWLPLPVLAAANLTRIA